MNIDPLKRTNVMLYPDRTRVLIRPFTPASSERMSQICAMVMSLPETEVHALLERVEADFGERHLKIRKFLRRRFEHVRPYVRKSQELSEERELLLGAHFTNEYSLEAAALFNPSIVPHPDQSDLAPGALRFVLSLRATGEGHISSITFRTGFVDVQNQISINTPTRFLAEPRHVPNASYDKALFEGKLYELGLAGAFTRRVLGELMESFTLSDLQKKLDSVLRQMRATDPESESVAKGILHLAQSNYEV